MDTICVDCGVAITGGRGRIRCKGCAAVERWQACRPLDYVAPRCVTCGREITGRDKAKVTHCSIECKYADLAVRSKMGPPRNGVEKICPHCERTFVIPVSNASRYIYCSRGCSSAARTRATACRRCGMPFRYSQTQIRSYCSEACRRPPVLLNCEECGVTFRTTPSSAATKRRFCSVRCHMASNAETSIERIVRLALSDLGLDFKIQVGIGPWVVDFAIGNLVIEADGSYWHTLRPHVDRRKTADLESRGLAVWRLTEAEIKKPGFPPDIALRLANYEIANGKLPRVAPSQASPVFPDQDGMIVGEACAPAPGDDANDRLVND